MLLTYFLNEFELVPFAPIITGITFVFTFHMRCIFVVRSLYFRIFIIIIIIIIIIIACIYHHIQPIHSHIPETNRVSRVFNVSDIL